MTEKNRYLKSVRRQLKKAGDRDGEYFAVICQEVDTYCAEHPSATAEDLRACFGAPPSHVDEFYRSMPDGLYRQKLIIQKRFFAFIKVVLAISAATVIILLTILVADTWSFTHGTTEYSDAQSGFAESDPNAIATY